MRTLYISDLDGTLLNSNAEISFFTAQTLNELIEKGMLFSFATARSYTTAGQITAGITARFPLILYNGAVIVDNVTGRPVITNFFADKQAWEIVDILLAGEVWPLVYHYDGNVESMTFDREKSTEELKDFIYRYEGKLRHNPVCGSELLKTSGTFYLVCIDSKEKLYPLYCQLKEKAGINVIYQTDLYSGRQWLEIMSEFSGKANAVMMLKQKLNCDKVVCFGDGRNDISMFERCDEKYAVANAVEELKILATGVIGSNNDDAVAKWLTENRQY